MAKRNKRTPLQKFIKNCRKFLVNGKPMSQVVHWTIILASSGIFAVNIVKAGEVLEAVGK